MKSFLLILLCFAGVALSYSQARGGQIVVEITKLKRKTYTYKVIRWVNRSRDSSWAQSIEKHLNQSTPVKNRAKKGKYIATVNFIEDKDGNISDVECVNDPGFGLCAPVVREIKKSGAWVVPKGGSVVRPYKH